MSLILITGASGFIGAALSDALRAEGRMVRTAGRGADVDVAAPTLCAEADWRAALKGAHSLVHLAGPAHARFDAAVLRASITEGSAALAAQAEAAGVRRFIFVSSLKAAAARTYDRPVAAHDLPAPEDGYGRAKLQAERAVLAHGALNPVILRPPLVFAPDAKANFAALLRLAASPLPLPFAGVRNKRSLIARASLIAAIRAALGEGPSGVFHVCDAPALSTGDMVAALRRGLGRAPGLFNAGPLAALAPAALTESLETDGAAFSAAFDWRAGEAAAELEACARAWAAR